MVCILCMTVARIPEATEKEEEGETEPKEKWEQGF